MRRRDSKKKHTGDTAAVKTQQFLLIRVISSLPLPLAAAGVAASTCGTVSVLHGTKWDRSLGTRRHRALDRHMQA